LKKFLAMRFNRVFKPADFQQVYSRREFHRAPFTDRLLQSRADRGQ
jgi:hypothetical protein